MTGDYLLNIDGFMTFFYSFRKSELQKKLILLQCRIYDQMLISLF